MDQAGPEGAVFLAKIIAFEPPPSGATTGPTVRLNQAAAQAVTDVEVRYWADVQCEISQADLQLGPSSVGLFVGNTASNFSLSSLIARPKQTSSQEVGVMAAAQASLTIAESVDLSTLNTSVRCRQFTLDGWTISVSEEVLGGQARNRSSHGTGPETKS